MAACATRSKAAERRGPFLSIVAGPETTPPRRPIVPASISLALGGLPREELAHLREHLRESTDTALRRAAPALLDLGEGAGEEAATDPLRQALPDLPALTAATNLLGSPWEAPGISVRLRQTCDAAASRCVPLFAPDADPADALVRRGRALAWALVNAALLRVPASSRSVLLRALHAARARPESTIAMVFDAARGTLDEAELGLLRREARAALEQIASDAPQRPWLEALDTAQGTWALPIELEADQLLVVPRLSALARLQDFASEVEGAGTFEWVFRPGVARRR
jgi:hypothetical protein